MMSEELSTAPHNESHSSPPPERPNPYEYATSAYPSPFASAASSSYSSSQPLARTFNDLKDAGAAVGAFASAIVFSGCLGGLIFILFEQYNRYIKFWAWQTFLVFIPFFIVRSIFFFAAIGSGNTGVWVMVYILWFVEVFIALFLGFYAYKGVRDGFLWKFPYCGNISAQRIKFLPEPPPNPVLEV